MSSILKTLEKVFVMWVVDWSIEQAILLFLLRFIHLNSFLLAHWLFAWKYIPMADLVQNRPQLRKKRLILLYVLAAIIFFNSVCESYYWTKTNYCLINHLPMKNYEQINRVLFLVHTGFLLIDVFVILVSLAKVWKFTLDRKVSTNKLMMIMHVLMLLLLIVASILGLFDASTVLNLTITNLFFMIDLFIMYVLVRESRFEITGEQVTVQDVMSSTEISEGTVSQNLVTKRGEVFSQAAEDDPLSKSMLNMFINYNEEQAAGSPTKRVSSASSDEEQDQERL